MRTRYSSSLGKLNLHFYSLLTRRTEGYIVTPETVGILSPYLTRHIKRFGDYIVDMENIPEALNPDLFFLTNWGLRKFKVGRFYTYPEIDRTTPKNPITIYPQYPQKATLCRLFKMSETLSPLATFPTSEYTYFSCGHFLTPVAPRNTLQCPSFARERVFIPEMRETRW